MKDGKLVLTVKKAGKAKVTVTDAKSSKTAELTAQTYMLAFNWANIPAGTYTMGSPDPDPDARDYERP